MHAILMLSQSPVGLRQTVIAKTSDQHRTFTRVGFARGLAATWAELRNDMLEEELYYEPVLGTVKVIAMTAAHVRDVNYIGRTPNNVLQAILKNLPHQLSASPDLLGDVFMDMQYNISNNPANLTRYMSTSYPVLAIPPVTPVIPIAEVVETPVALAVEFDRQPSRAPTQTTPTPVLALATTVAEAITDSETLRELAVLSSPEKFLYIERKFQGVLETEMYDKSTKLKWNVMLSGDAGTGKSSSARNLAVQRNVPFVVVECNQQIDLSVTQGRFVPGPDGKTLKWVYSQLATAIQQPSVILLNEFTRMNPKSSALFMRILEERELAVDTFNEVLKIHPECQIIADANMGGMYSGTTRADAAFLDRFLMKLQFEYDTALESKFLPYPALLNFASAIRKASDLGQQDFTVPMSTRLLKGFVSQAQEFNWKFAVERLLSSFPSDTGERNAVKTRLEADAPAIAQEIGIAIN